MPLFAIVVLLIYSISNTAVASVVQGTVQVFLPQRTATTASVLIQLVEKRQELVKRIIAKQRCTLSSSASCAISLQYLPQNIDQQKNYSIDIIVSNPKDKSLVYSKDSFPILTFGHSDTLNIIMSIPSKMVE